MKILGIISGIGGVIIIGTFIYWGIGFLKKLKIEEIKIRKEDLKEEVKFKIKNLWKEPIHITEIGYILKKSKEKVIMLSNPGRSDVTIVKPKIPNILTCLLVDERKILDRDIKDICQIYITDTTEKTHKYLNIKKLRGAIKLAKMS